ncbi:MAG: hypothetical protein ABUS79_01455 [Pseudomonadota bacterium]
MPPTFEEIKMLISPSEGNISHMYLDTVGRVTVGIGNMLPTDAAARALPFTNRISRNNATAAEISADFRTISAQPWPRVARFYRASTALDLPDVQINLLFRQRIEGFQQELRDSYPDYDTYPDPVQLAMLDMAFNLGTAGLKRTWPRLNRAIDSEDWAQAALECNRPQGNASRNTAVKELFEKGAEESDDSE